MLGTLEIMSAWDTKKLVGGSQLLHAKWLGLDSSIQALPDLKDIKTL
jgi:hypothetical protein